MTGSIKDYTPNFEFIIPEFNITGWHDYLEENFRSIDALFYNLFGINNFKGQWKNSTVYNVDEVVFVGEDTDYSGRLVKVLVQHTTAGTGNFTEFFTANPSYYELFADASTAQLYAQEAKDWAVKIDGPVEGYNYSSKYYADIVNSLSTEINSLYNIRNDIQTVSNIGTDIVNVADNEININTVASMQSDINDVVAIKSGIEWIADNDTIVTNVSNNSTKITTVANNISSVNTTATNITDINTVAGISSNITSVAGNSTNINTVASNNTNITSVAQNLSNIVAVNNNATNINTVASDINRVNLVADDIISVHTVAVDISNVIDVANNKTNIDAVVANSTNINAVANNATNINAVNANKTNIDAVVSNSSNINTVSTNISDINTAASNITAIQNASTYATNAQNSASLAQDWATKTNGLVDNTDYSAKHYAEIASQYENPLRIGQIIRSTLPLTDAGLHLLDGSLIQGNGIYSDFVTYIAGLVNTYPDLFETEANWQTSITNFGSCEKFVYDNVNNTVRLPKHTTEHGYLVKSYSNGADWYRIYSDGWCEQGSYSSTDASGTKQINLLVSYKDTDYMIYITSASNNGGSGHTFHAIANTENKTVSSFYTSKNEYYGISTVIGYWKTCGYINLTNYKNTIYEYIVLATSTKTDIQIDIDEIVTDLNGKADTDLSNINPTQTVKNTIISWGIPDYSATLSSVGNNYTAPCDGIFWFSVVNNNSSRDIKITPNGASQITYSIVYNSYGSPGGYQVVLGKGDNIVIEDTSTSLMFSYFIPLKGV